MYLYQFYIIIMYKYTFITKYFTHLHKMLVGRLESNMDYENIDHFLVMLVLFLFWLWLLFKRRTSNSASHIGRFYFPAPPILWFQLMEPELCFLLLSFLFVIHYFLTSVHVVGTLFIGNSSLQLGVYALFVTIGFTVFLHCFCFTSFCSVLNNGLCRGGSTTIRKWVSFYETSWLLSSLENEMVLVHYSTSCILMSWYKCPL